MAPQHTKTTRRPRTRYQGDSSPAGRVWRASEALTAVTENTGTGVTVEGFRRAAFLTENFNEDADGDAGVPLAIRAHKHLLPAVLDDLRSVGTVEAECLELLNALWSYLDSQGWHFEDGQFRKGA